MKIFSTGRSILSIDESQSYPIVGGLKVHFDTQRICILYYTSNWFVFSSCSFNVPWTRSILPSYHVRMPVSFTVWILRKREDIYLFLMQKYVLFITLLISCVIVFENLSQPETGPSLFNNRHIFRFIPLNDIINILVEWNFPITKEKEVLLDLKNGVCKNFIIQINRCK